MDPEKCTKILQRIVQTLERLQNGLELGSVDDNQIITNLIDEIEGLIVIYKSSECINTETIALIERLEFLIKAMKHFFKIKKMNEPLFANGRALEVYILVEIQFLIKQTQKENNK